MPDNVGSVENRLTCKLWGGDVVKNIIFALLKAQEYAGRKDTY